MQPNSLESPLLPQAPSAGLALHMAYALDPVLWARECLGFIADGWQENFLRCSHEKRVLLNCARQAGKSQIAAIAALHLAIFVPGSIILFPAPTMRQSAELFGKLADARRRMANPPPLTTDNLTSCRFANGSRVISLPGEDAGNVRGPSPDLIVLDEAAYADDDLISALRPMLAVTNGRFILMSTPQGRKGAFWRCWESETERWHKIMVPATDCPRISAEFLEQERATISPSFYAQEYECAFAEGEGQLFSSHDIARAIVQRPHLPLHLTNGVKPRWATPVAPEPTVAEDEMPLALRGDETGLIVAMDVGQARDHTAIVVLAIHEEVENPLPAILAAWEPRTPWGSRLEREKITIRAQMVWASRMMLSTPYPDQVADVVALMQQITLMPGAPDASLWIDATGIGRGLLDMFEEAGLEPRGVSITGGMEVNIQSARDQRIPKNRLIGNLQLALATGRLTAASSIPALPTWVTEMENYTSRITASGTDSSSAFSENLHDDLVLATAIGCWAADHPLRRATLQIL